MTSPLAKKLGIRSGDTVAVVGAPDGVAELLEPLPEGAEPAAGRTSASCVLVFVKDLAALQAARPFDAARLLWVAYPKGGTKAGTDLNRDILWAELGKEGLAGVSLVAVNETWSAMRFRPEAEVGR